MLGFFLFLIVASNFYVGRPRDGYEVAAGSSVLGSADWFMWFVFLMFITVLFIADLMFLTDSEFVFDPVYDNWLEKCGYEHYRK